MAIASDRPRAPAPSPLLTAPILPTLTRLALPNTLALMATAGVATAETSYVGILGTEPLAGLALVFPMVMLMQMMSSGAMGGGVASAISRALGGGDELRARELAMHAIAIGICGGLLFTLVFRLLGREIFTVLGGKGRVLEQALAYADMLFPGAVVVWLVNTTASILRGTGNMKVPSSSFLLIAALQIVLGGCLGLGLGPFPRMEMRGVALGFVLAWGIGLLVLLWFLITGRGRLKLGWSGPPSHSVHYVDILKVGMPAMISPVFSVASSVILTSYVARFGTEALAGFGIGARLEFMLIPITFAVGVACVPMVGMAIGAGNPERARRVAWTGALMSGVLLGAVGLTAALFPWLWSNLFSRETAVLQVANAYLSRSGPGYAVLGFGLCLYFACQGSGRVMLAVLGSSLRPLTILIGGWLVLRSGAPVESLFYVVALSMAGYGIGVSSGVYFTPWGDRGVRAGKG